MDRMRTVLMAAVLAALPALAQRQVPAPPPDSGFFRPSADPALTSFGPPPSSVVTPVPAPAPEQASAAPSMPPSPASVDVAEQIRKTEELAMDRAEREHDRARARAAATAIAPPAVVSAGAPVEPERY
jgi:hypothetical protein